MGGVAESSRAFRAMGSDCVVRVVADAEKAEFLLDGVEAEMQRLENKWSRFLDSSELSQLNRHSGSPVFVSEETFALVSLAIDAYRATEGRFDPTLLDALRAAGYDVPFDRLRQLELIETGAVAHRRYAIDEIELDQRSSLIHTPKGVHFDLGGIGKGHAADVLFDQLINDGVQGASLDFGGDIRVGGTPLAGGGWSVIVDDPFHEGRDIVEVGLGEGSVTTSSSVRRSWPTVAGSAHHLLDPGTLRPSESGVASVTVIAASAAWGEVHAKAALIAGLDDGPRCIERAGLSALFIDEDGGQTTAGDFERFVVGGPTLAS